MILAHYDEDDDCWTEDDDSLQKVTIYSGLVGSYISYSHSLDRNLLSFVIVRNFLFFGRPGYLLLFSCYGYRKEIELEMVSKRYCFVATPTTLPTLVFYWM